MTEIQEETGHFYNLEATPAEGTAKPSRSWIKEVSGYYLRGRRGRRLLHQFYTAPGRVHGRHFRDDGPQDELQSLYTGGTVLHLYLGERISDVEVAKT